MTSVKKCVKIKLPIETEIFKGGKPMVHEVKFLSYNQRDDVFMCQHVSQKELFS